MKKLLFATLMLVLLCAGTAFADTYTLNQSACCGSGPFGTITVTQGVDPQTVQITLVMNSPIGNVDTGAHWTLSFNIAGDPAVTMNLPTGYSRGTDNAANAPYGTFMYTVACDVCGNGSTNPQNGFTFTVTLTGAGTLSPSDFVGNGQGVYFAVDVYDPSIPATGVVATGGTPEVPEPGSLMLLGSGLLGAGGFLRRRFLS